VSQDDELKKLVIDSSLEAIKVGYAEGRLFEQERIIKLLESPEVRAEWIEATSNALPTYQGVVDFFTAKIKGEQK
jgi:hypothetical protein